MDHLDEISVKGLHDALDNVEGKKSTQRLLAVVAYKMVSRRPNLPSGITLTDEQSTVGEIT